MKRPGLPLKTAFLIAAALAAGCGAPKGGRIAVTLYTSAPAGTGYIRGEVPGYIDEDITDFRICVSVPGTNDARCKNFNLEKYKSGDKARIDNLPVGRERRVTFQGYNMATLEVFWCGEVSGVEIKKDSTTRVEMFISACRRFTPVRNEMQSPRVFHTATKLPDGRVLIVGGFSSVGAIEPCSAGTCRVLAEPSETLGIYDPQTGELEKSDQFILNYPRGLHTATLLEDGRVLVAGGCGSALLVVNTQNATQLVRVVTWDDAGDSAEIVDPVGLTVDKLDGPMPEQRAGHAAMSLPGGDVFLLGGIGATGPDDSALQSGAYYRASSGIFEGASQDMEVPRQGFALVPYGTAGTRALIWGGNQPSGTGPGEFAELLSVGDTGEVSLSGAGFVADVTDLSILAFHSAGTQISTGDVLVTGGVVLNEQAEPKVSSGFWLISMDPDSKELKGLKAKEANVSMNFFAGFHTATLLGKLNWNEEEGKEDSDFKVLVAGGFTNAGAADLLFEPQSNVRFFQHWETGNDLFIGEKVALTEPRAGHTATALDDGTVLFTGGFTDGTGGLAITSTAEVFNAAPRELRAE